MIPTIKIPRKRKKIIIRVPPKKYQKEDKLSEKTKKTLHVAGSALVLTGTGLIAVAGGSAEEVQSLTGIAFTLIGILSGLFAGFKK